MGALLITLIEKDFQKGYRIEPMNNKSAFSAVFRVFSILILLSLLLSLIGTGFVTEAASTMPGAKETVHVHGQIRDGYGTPTQGYVYVGTYLGSVLASGLSDEAGNYQFDVSGQDHYVITVVPVQRVTVGNAEVNTGYLDKWSRVNRTTETDLTIDMIVKPGGTLLLDAYDPLGNRMFRDDFPDANFFANYPLGELPLDLSIQMQNHQMPTFWGWETILDVLYNPAAIFLSSQMAQPVTIWGLWPIPEAGTIMIEMDNGGLGFSLATGQVLTINIPYEFARTELRKAQQKYDQGIAAGYEFSPTLSISLTQAQATLLAAQLQLESGDRPGAAVASYPVLTAAILVKEQVTLEVAQQDIETYRSLPVTITLTESDLQPLGNAQVEVQQVNHDFILSANWPADGAPVGDTPETTQLVGNYNYYVDLVKQIGFEYVNYPPTAGWGSVQAEWPTVPFSFREDVIVRQAGDSGLRKTGFNIWMAGSPFYAYPSFLDGLSYPEIKAAALDYITTTLARYSGKIQWWNLVNEPHTANGCNFTPTQMFDFTQSVLAAAKAADPEGEMSVLLGSPGLGTSLIVVPPGEQFERNFSTYNYLNQMLDYGIQPDAIGIQFYNGAYEVPFDLGTVSDLLDVYGRDFDLPFYIEELEYPTHEEYPDLQGTMRWGWHQGQTDQAQADWAVGLYTIAFSKSHLVGANWSMSYDLPATGANISRAGDGYLHRDGLTLRPMGYALSDLFHSWTTSGVYQTNMAGQLNFNGFAGEYLLTITTAEGAVRQEMIHVREGQTNNSSFIIDPNQQLIENQQLADESLGESLHALDWSNRLGKISGVLDAVTLLSQAQISYGTGDYWDAYLLREQAQKALAFDIDGQMDDWAGIVPLFSQTDQQGQANRMEMRNFYGAMDDSALYLQFEFDPNEPKRDLLFELDTGADGVLDYHAHIVPNGSYSILLDKDYESDPALVWINLIPSIDVIYDNTVEIRIPLADLGNPEKVSIAYYREFSVDGGISEVLASLGVVQIPPWQVYLPTIIR
jgi:hypothetical protein